MDKKAFCVLGTLFDRASPQLNGIKVRRAPLRMRVLLAKEHF